jgi:hypothetical protein
MLAFADTLKLGRHFGRQRDGKCSCGTGHAHTDVRYYSVLHSSKYRECVKRDAYVRDGVVHHAGNEAAWWRDMSIDALEIARALAGKPPKISVSRGVELSGNRRHSRDLPQP